MGVVCLATFFHSIVLVERCTVVVYCYHPALVLGGRYFLVAAARWVPRGSVVTYCTGQEVTLASLENISPATVDGSPFFLPLVNFLACQTE